MTNMMTNPLDIKSLSCETILFVMRTSIIRHDEYDDEPTSHYYVCANFLIHSERGHFDEQIGLEKIEHSRYLTSDPNIIVPTPRQQL